MPSPRKRPRVSDATDLQAQILSVFASAALAPTRPAASAAISHEGQTAPFHLTSLCESLTCVSTTRAPLNALQQELESRVYSPLELSRALFCNADDGPEAIPPLCVLSALLTAATLRVPDFPPLLVAKRAAHEMLADNACGCRGLHAGVRKLLECLQEDAGPATDAFLGRFVDILFRDWTVVDSHAPPEVRFRLAELTIRYLREHSKGEGIYAQFCVWLRQAVLPTRVQNAPFERTIAWTPELSGLATGRSPAEYLECRTVQEKAFSALCTAVLPSVATKVFLECVNTLLASDGRSESTKRYATGTWSRVVILIRRILDTDSFADADSSERKCMESTLSATLCSVQSLKDIHTTAVLMCIARWVFFPNGPAKSGEGSSISHSDHEKWLKGLVRANGGKVAKGIIKALDYLVSLEPLRILRTNHRVFSANRQYLPLCGDYLVRVRTRISELDPLHTADSRPNSKQQGSNVEQVEATKRVQENVTKFVYEFSEGKGSLSAPLIRQMNFHRYHFKGTTLPILLDPKLEPMRDGRIDLRMDKNTFDEHRINMIKVMAFKRKDQAVTKEEAQKAIERIIELKKSRAARNHDSNKQQEPNEPTIKGISSMSKITEILVRQVLSNGVPTNTDEDQSQEGLQAVSGTMSRLQEVAAKTANEADSSTLALEILQGFLDGLEDNEAVTEMASTHLDGQELYRKCQEWWADGGLVFDEMLPAIFHPVSFRSYLKPLQLQLFALVCTRNHCLSSRTVTAAAVLSCALYFASRYPVLSDLCFLVLPGSKPKITQLPLSMFRCLPVADPLTLISSAKFALSCCCLLRSAKERRYFEHSQNDNHQNDNHGFTSVPPDPGVTVESESLDLALAHLLHLLRWVLTSPWRFVVSKENDSNSVLNASLSETGSLLERIAVECKSQQTETDDAESLREWLRIEYRCGWGLPDKVQHILETYECLGVQPDRIVAETCLFLATQTGSNQSFWGWILQGLTRFADEHGGEELNLNGKGRDHPIPSLLRRCVVTNGSAAGKRMLDMLSMTSQSYYHGFSPPEISQHMGFFMVPYFWPFSTGCLRYIMGSIRKTCSTLQTEFESELGYFFLIPNILMKWRSFATDLQNWEPSSSGMAHFTSQARGIRNAVNVLIHMEGVSHFDTTQLPSQSPPLLSQHRKTPRLIGMAFVLCLVAQSQIDPSDMVFIDQAASSAFAALQGSDAVLTAIDIIDAVLASATFMPFTSYFSGNDMYGPTVDRTNHILKIFLQERVRLSSTSKPAWATEKQERKIRTQSDIRAILLLWLGRDTHMAMDTPDEYLSRSLAVGVCMSRLYITMHSLPDEAFSLFLSTHDSETLSTAFIPNLLTSYQILTMDTSKLATEKLSSSSLERLTASRDTLVRPLLDIIGKTVAYMPTSHTHRREDTVGRILLNFPEQADEIRLFLQDRLQLEY